MNEYDEARKALDVANKAAVMAPDAHEPLPVAGYTSQTSINVELVNNNKRVEELVLQLLDTLASNPNTDKRWLAIGRTSIEQGFMAVNRAVFRPTRLRA